MRFGEVVDIRKVAKAVSVRLSQPRLREMSMVHWYWVFFKARTSKTSFDTILSINAQGTRVHLLELSGILSLDSQVRWRSDESTTSHDGFVFISVIT